MKVANQPVPYKSYLDVQERLTKDNRPLSDKEIAVLLCGASATHAASVSARLTQMLTVEDSTGAVVAPSIGMTTRVPDSAFEGSIVGAARALAASRH